MPPQFCCRCLDLELAQNSGLLLPPSPQATENKPDAATSTTHDDTAADPGLQQEVRLMVVWLHRQLYKCPAHCSPPPFPITCAGAFQLHLQLRNKRGELCAYLQPPTGTLTTRNQQTRQPGLLAQRRQQRRLLPPRPPQQQLQATHLLTHHGRLLIRPLTRSSCSSTLLTATVSLGVSVHISSTPTPSHEEPATLQTSTRQPLCRISPAATPGLLQLQTGRRQHPTARSTPSGW